MSTPNDAINYVKRFLGNVPVDDTALKLRLLDDAHKLLWMADNWPWTVASLEVVTLVNDTQDVNLVNTYTDFLSLQHAYMISGNGQTKDDLRVASVLPVTTSLKGRPTQVQYVAGSPNKLRFFPVPTGYATLPTTQVPKVIGIYKKKSALIDNTSAAADYTTTSGVPADYFWVFQEIVLLKGYEFTHDPRLGSVQVGPQGTVYSGQYAVVQDALAYIRRNEEKFFTTLGETVNG